MKSGAVRRAATAVLLVARIGVVSGSTGLNLPTATSSTTSLTSITAAPAKIPPILLSATSTNTSTRKTYSVKNRPLYLPVTTAPPDPLGIATVSGVYGPGTWAGWFLTLVAAWWRIFRASEEKLDPNTWAFLFGCNWAAVDILRSIHSITTAATPAEARSKFGLYGAAFTVVFWGTLHGLCQFCLTLVAFQHRDGRDRRLRTLAIGMVLPVITLQSAGIHAIQGLNSDYGFIPALYWYAMGQSTNALLLLLASWTPIIVVLPIWIYFLFKDDSFAPALTAVIRTAATAVVVVIQNNTIKSLFLRWVIVSFPVAYVSAIAISVTNNWRWVIGIIPFDLVLAPLMLVYTLITWIIILPFCCIIYVFKGYFHLGSNISGSCFFMPCAPQSLRDSDQLYPLIFGLLSFVGFEVVPIVYKNMNARFKRWQDNRASIKETADHLREHELRRMSTPGLTRRNTPGTVV
jgi:hypothetical protein